MLRKTLYGATIIFASLTALASAQTSGTSTMQPATSGGAAALSQSDHSFILNAGQAGLAEVMEGQLAQQKGDAAVQKIGAQMVADHTKVNNQLKMQAQALGATVPSSPSAAQQAQYSKLEGMSGSSFDRTYLMDQRAAHKMAIAVFDRESTGGGNAQLKTLATETLPTLREHLKMITAAEGTGSAS